MDAGTFESPYKAVPGIQADATLKSVNQPGFDAAMYRVEYGSDGQPMVVLNTEALDAMVPEEPVLQISTGIRERAIEHSFQIHPDDDHSAEFIKYQS